MPQPEVSSQAVPACATIPVPKLGCAGDARRDRRKYRPALEFFQRLPSLFFTVKIKFTLQRLFEVFLGRHRFAQAQIGHPQMIMNEGRVGGTLHGFLQEIDCALKVMVFVLDPADGIQIRRFIALQQRARQR